MSFTNFTLPCKLIQKSFFFLNVYFFIKKKQNNYLINFSIKKHIHFIIGLSLTYLQDFYCKEKSICYNRLKSLLKTKSTMFSNLKCLFSFSILHFLKEGTTNYPTFFNDNWSTYSSNFFLSKLMSMFLSLSKFR